MVQETNKSVLIADMITLYDPTFIYKFVMAIMELIFQNKETVNNIGGDINIIPIFYPFCVI